MFFFDDFVVRNMLVGAAHPRGPFSFCGGRCSLFLGVLLVDEVVKNLLRSPVSRIVGPANGSSELRSHLGSDVGVLREVVRLYVIVADPGSVHLLFVEEQNFVFALI